MRIGYDLDGCGHGFLERCNWIRTQQKEPLFTAGSWHFYREVGMTDEDWVNWCHKAADDGLLFGGEMLPGAVEASKRTKEMGHTNVIITDRTFGATRDVSRRLTIENLTQSGFIYDEIHFDADKTAYGVDMMVEDKWENFVDCTEAGIDCYLIDAPWNAHGGPHPKRIKNISEYADIIEQATINGFVDLALV